MSALTRPQLRSELGRYASQMEVWGVDPQQFIAATLVAATKVPAILSCTPQSIALALLQCAQSGLEIGRTAHLVPFKGSATFVPDYKGLIELAIATRTVRAITVRCVYEGEEFRYMETSSGPDIRHAPRTSGTGGVIVGAYAIADLPGNRCKVEWMTAEDIEAIRRNSKQWASGVLPDWYARKTVVRRICKTLPSSPKLHAALRNDDAEPDAIADAEVSEIPTPSALAPHRTLMIPAPPDGDEYGVGELPIATVAEDPTDTHRATARAMAAMPDPYEEAA